MDHQARNPDSEIIADLGTGDRGDYVENVHVMVLWMLGEKQEAEEKAARAVQVDSPRLLALSNMAYILWHHGKTEEAEHFISTMKSLKETEDPSVYDDLEYQAQAELAYVYLKLGTRIKPFDLSDHLERLSARRPEDQRMKIKLALTLRRYTHKSWKATYPDVDLNQHISRTADLFVEMMSKKTNFAGLKAFAAAELGQILKNNEGERQRLGMKPEDCFNEAVPVALAENIGSVLTRAGMFYRYQNDLDKSRNLLQKAISVRPNSKAFHQLGITLKKIALLPDGMLKKKPGPQECQQGYYRPKPARLVAGGDNVHSDKAERGLNSCLSLRRSYHGPATVQRLRGTASRTPSSTKLSKSNRVVQQAINSFRKSVELCGENMPALFDLVRISMDVDDYEEALDVSVSIAETWPSRLSCLHQALELAGKALRGMSKRHFEKEQVAKKMFYEELSSLSFAISLTMQCLIFLTCESSAMKLSSAFWGSLDTLKKTFNTDWNIFMQTLGDCSRDEKHLMKSFWQELIHLPTWAILSNVNVSESKEDKVIFDKIHELRRTGYNVEALVILSLLNLKLKHNYRYEITNYDVTLLLRAAKDRCLRKLEVSTSDQLPQNSVLLRLSVAISHSLFLQAVKLGITKLKNLQKYVSDTSLLQDSLGHIDSSPDAGNSSLGRSLPKNRIPERSPRLFQESDPVLLDESEKDGAEAFKNPHIVFIHDPLDNDVTRDVKTMQRLLGDVCGLKTVCLKGSGDYESGREEDVEMEEIGQGHCAQLYVIVVRQKEQSEEFISQIQRLTQRGGCEGAGHSSTPLSSLSSPAAAARNSRHLQRVLLLNSAPLPQTLQGLGPASSWRMPCTVDQSGSSSRSSFTTSDVKAAYRLLSCLLGLLD